MSVRARADRIPAVTLANRMPHSASLDNRLAFLDKLMKQPGLLAAVESGNVEARAVL